MRQFGFAVSFTAGATICFAIVLGLLVDMFSLGDGYGE